MRKLFFAILIVIVVVTFASYNVFQSQKVETMSELMTANVEALASSEEGGATLCGGPKVNSECRSTNTINCRDLTGCQ